MLLKIAGICVSAQSIAIIEIQQLTPTPVFWLVRMFFFRSMHTGLLAHFHGGTVSVLFVAFFLTGAALIPESV